MRRRKRGEKGERERNEREEKTGMKAEGCTSTQQSGGAARLVDE
jgi:hypothetical protein